jgi:hypothetical protein
MPLQSGATRRQLIRDAAGNSRVGANTADPLPFVGACRPYRPLMEILTQRDYVDDEMPRRDRARIADSTIAARSARFADSQASAGVLLHIAWNILPPDFAAIEIGEVDDCPTISAKHAPATILQPFAPPYTKLTRQLRPASPSF